jgi:hypothetical protein
MTVNSRDTIIEALETKFLCVLPKLQKKRLTPVLIKELKRRAALNGVKVGIFVSKLIIGKPVNSSVFYSRPLNVKKILGTGFLRQPPSLNLK